jgi:hypothetical protein
MSLNYDAAIEILEFMDKYNEHFKELRAFINEKQEKVAGDDLVWLLDSLSEEQKFIMRGNSLEAKRNLIFDENGIDGCDSAQLIAQCPEELKGRMRLTIESIENSVHYIKETNQNVLDMARRKLEAQAELLEDSLVAGSDTYNNTGTKIKKISDDDTFIGSV